MKKILSIIIFVLSLSLYSQEIVNLGSAPNAGDGDNLRTAFGKVNTNFTTIFDSLQWYIEYTDTISTITTRYYLTTNHYTKTVIIDSIENKIAQYNDTLKLVAQDTIRIEDSLYLNGTWYTTIANVATSGSPTTGQMAIFTSPTTVTGTDTLDYYFNKQEVTDSLLSAIGQNNDTLGLDLTTQQQNGIMVVRDTTIYTTDSILWKDGSLDITGNINLTNDLTVNGNTNLEDTLFLNGNNLYYSPNDQSFVIAGNGIIVSDVNMDVVMELKSATNYNSLIFAGKNNDIMIEATDMDSSITLSAKDIIMNNYAESGDLNVLINGDINTTGNTKLGTNTLDSTHVTGDLHVDGKLNLNHYVNSTETNGDLWSDTLTGTLNYKNDISGITLQIGEEFRHRVYNNSGSTIVNGRLVRRTGTHINEERYPTIALAGNSTLDSSQVYGMTTHDILDNSYGYIIKAGDVNFLNTLLLSEDGTYLGHAGEPIDTSPPPPYLSVMIGECIYSDNDSGIIDIHLEHPMYNPSPLFSSDTSGLNQTISIAVDGEYEYLPLSNTIIDNNFGFSVVGDSVQVGVSGYYQIVLSMSFQGAVTTAVWNYGVFINNGLQHKKTRSTSSNSTGDTNLPISRRLQEDDWVSFRIANIGATTDPVIVDMGVQIIFLHE